MQMFVQKQKDNPKSKVVAEPTKLKKRDDKLVVKFQHVNNAAIAKKREEELKAKRESS